MCTHKGQQSARQQSLVSSLNARNRNRGLGRNAIESGRPDSSDDCPRVRRGARGFCRPLPRELLVADGFLPGMAPYSDQYQTPCRWSRKSVVRRADWIRQVSGIRVGHDFDLPLVRKTNNIPCCGWRGRSPCRTKMQPRHRWFLTENARKRLAMGSSRRSIHIRCRCRNRPPVVRRGVFVARQRAVAFYTAGPSDCIPQ